MGITFLEIHLKAWVQRNINLEHNKDGSAITNRTVLITWLWTLLGWHDNLLCPCSTAKHRITCSLYSAHPQMYTYFHVFIQPMSTLRECQRRKVSHQYTKPFELSTGSFSSWAGRLTESTSYRVEELEIIRKHVGLLPSALAHWKPKSLGISQAVAGSLLQLPIWWDRVIEVTSRLITKQERVCIN